MYRIKPAGQVSIFSCAAAPAVELATGGTLEPATPVVTVVVPAARGPTAGLLGTVPTTPALPGAVVTTPGAAAGRQIPACMI